MQSKSHSGRYRHIHACTGIFRHIQTYPDIIRHIQELFRNYSGIFWTLRNPGTFRALVHSESWHIQNQRYIQNLNIYSESWTIQNPGIFRTGGILRTLLKSKIERFEEQQTTIIIFANCNYFRNFSFSCSLAHEINISFSMQF